MKQNNYYLDTNLNTNKQKAIGKIATPINYSDIPTLKNTTLHIFSIQDLVSFIYPNNNNNAESAISELLKLCASNGIIVNFYHENINHTLKSDPMAIVVTQIMVAAYVYLERCNQEYGI